MWISSKYLVSWILCIWLSSTLRNSKQHSLCSCYCWASGLIAVCYCWLYCTLRQHSVYCSLQNIRYNHINLSHFSVSHFSLIYSYFLQTGQDRLYFLIVVMLGENGTGKTTFIRMLVLSIDILMFSISYGYSNSIGYVKHNCFIVYCSEFQHIFAFTFCEFADRPTVNSVSTAGWFIEAWFSGRWCRNTWVQCFL